MEGLQSNEQIAYSLQQLAVRLGGLSVGFLRLESHAVNSGRSASDAES